MIRIICVNINRFYNVACFHVRVKFNLKLSAAAGRDLPVRKESSGAASTGLNPFDYKSSVSGIPEFKRMPDCRFPSDFSKIIGCLVKNNC